MSRRPRIESLEDRRLLAVVLQPTTGTISANVVSGDQYFDSGNIGGVYSNNEDGVLTLDSGPGSVLQVDFTSFETEGFNLDLLRIFDGSDTTTPLIGTFQGASFFGNEDPPGTITGTNNELTFEFITDSSVVFSGWEANVNVFAQDLIIGGTGGDDDFTIGLNGAGQLEVTIGGAPANIAPYGMSPFDTTFLNSVTVVGGAGDDSLTVDFSNGPIPGLSFDGGTQTTTAGDSLTILGTFTDQILNYTTTTPGEGNNGNLNLDGATITYTGLEPINAGSAANTTLNLPVAFANNATLQNSANPGEIEIIDNGATFENTVIPNPTNSLTVNLGNAGDLLNVTTLDAGYAASLIINGGTDPFQFDTVQLTDVDLDTANTGRGLWVTETEALGVTGGTISNNTALVGGGILIDNATSIFGTFTTLDDVTVTGNTATGGLAPTEGGGGIFNRGGGFLQVINGSMITNNVATTGSGSGGGIFSSGLLTVDSSTISGNSANRAGGGIEISGMSGTTTLTNVTLTNNQAVGAPGNGGGMHISGTVDTNILGGTVSGNSAALEGGGLWNGSGTMTIDGTTIDSNTASGDGADEGGGGIFNNGGTVEIGNNAAVNIINNVADGDSGSGGGVHNLGLFTMSGGSIAGNSANRAGGGLEEASPNAFGFILVNVNTDNNVATGNANGPGNGGGVHISGAAGGIISGGTVSGNSAALEGGGLWNGSGQLQVNGTTIDGNTASGDAADDGGGGIFNNTGGTVTLQNGVQITNNVADGVLGSGGGILNFGGTLAEDSSGIVITGNTAERAGGGIEHASSVTLSLTNVTLDGNSALGTDATAPGNGGGLHITGTANSNISGGTVNNNNAAREGGGLWNDTGTMTIDGTTISGNTASGDAADDGGGGIFNNGGLLQIGLSTPVDITNNVADGDAGSGGGILNLAGFMDVGGGTTITGNSAKRAGGGIETTGGPGLTTILNGVTLNNNLAIGGGVAGSPGNGGGLHVSGAGDINITGGSVSGNSAAFEGGGLWNGGGTMFISATTIDGNTASGDGADDGGGGIFNNGGEIRIDFQPVSITNNVANGVLGSGGGIFNLDPGTLNFAPGLVTISGNSAERAGGGIEHASSTTLFLNNVTLDSNSALGTDATSSGNGGGLHISGAADSFISFGTVNNNNAAEEGGGLWNGGGIMTIDSTQIDGNTASGGGSDQGGGGIFNAGGTVNVNFSAITNNTANGASGSGGGILNDALGQVTVFASTIDSNVANRAGGGIEATAGTTTFVTGSLLINNNAGVAPAVAAPGNGGGLHITGDGNATIDGSLVDGNVAANEGGGLWNGAGTMTVVNSSINGNTASGPNSDDGGGGIFNDGGVVDIDNVGITNNVADGAAGSGGGILNTIGGTITINNSLIGSNTAVRAGGGIENNVGSITIVDSTIRMNDAGSAPGRGGGIHITGAGDVSIDGSTIHNNTAIEGGGLWNSGVGTFTLTNSTISTNTATGSSGGGIFNTDGGSITTDSVTITLNDATGGGSGIDGGTGGVTLENTIVAQNPGGGTEDNLAGAINSDDFNLIGDPDNGVLTGLTVNTIFGGDALLLPLVDNGGPTLTHVPGAGSPAIGNGVTTLLVDQRDIARPQGSQDDIGAVEVDLDGFVVTANDAPLVGQAGDGNPDEFRIINDNNGLTGNVLVFVNSQLLTQTFPKATTGLIVIRGSADDDTVIIDNSNGLIGTRIVFDGDGTGGPAAFPTPGGFDKLILRGSTPTTTTYNPGSTVDAGAVFQENNQITQKVEFFGLEPVQVIAPVGGNNVLNVAAAPLGVGFPQALNTDNAINYTQGPNSNDPVDPVFAGALTGLITVDGFESLEFANFEVLNIDAGAGSDEISLNNPVTPSELGTINIDGGDPTAGSDILVVNGTIGQDTITVDQLTNAGGRVTGAQPVEVNFTETELLIIDGQDGDDTLTYTSPDSSVIDYFPGVSVGHGEVLSQFGNSRVDVRFEDLGAFATLDIASDSGNRSSRLDFRGTASDDVFDVSSTGLIQTERFLSNTIEMDVTTSGVSSLTLIGLDGDDTFNIPGDHPFEQVTIQGGNPDSGSDVLNFTGSGVGEVTVDLDAQTITEVGFGAVSFTGVEHVNVDANAALIIAGTAGNDIYDVTPLGASNDGRFSHNLTSNVSFSYNDATSITFNGGTSGNDTLNVLGDDFANVVTSTATTLTVDGSKVTFDTAGADAIEGLNLFTFGGDDTVTLTGLTMNATVDAGAGNDTVDASGVADDNVQLHLIGGAGNDNLIGGESPTGSALGDVLEGGDGDDRLEGGRGQDFFFGGAGSDQLVWVAGDGSDLMEGGDGEDEMLFDALGGNNRLELLGGGRFGATSNPAPNVFGPGTLGNAARAIFVLNSVGQDTAAVFLNMGEIEQINIDAGAGADQVILNNQLDAVSANGDPIQLGTNLAATSVNGIEVNLGSADGAADNVEFHGRQTADDVNISLVNGDIDVAGFSYSIRISDAEVADDSLIGHGQGGNDVIKAESGVEAAIAIILNGDAGDDFLSADAILNGGAGNDTLIGGLGNDTINGGAGDDVIDARGGNNTIDGGTGTDTILVSGTAAAETLSTVHAGGAFTITGGLSAGTNTIANIQQVRIEAGDGVDTVNVTTDPAGGLDYNIFGGNPIGVLQGAGDTLNVVLGGSPFTFVPGPEGDAGGVLAQSNQTISFDEFERLQIDGINFLLPDAFEPNDSQATAKVLGSESAITVMRANLHASQMPSGGVAGVVNDDWYQVTAHDTGKLIVNAHFTADGVALDGDGGNVVINLFDSTGTLIVAGAAVTGGQQIVVPVVAQQRYFVQVTSADGDQNTYDLEIENFAAPIPATPFLSSGSDSGMFNNDNLTNDSTPTLVIQDDLAAFAAMNIPVDLGTAVAGAEVILSFTSATAGTVTTVEANLVNAANPTLWNATSAVLGDDVYLVQSWTRIQDAAGVVGRSPLSGAFLFTVDTTAPATPAAPDLLAIADSGPSTTDNVTKINAVAIAGTGVEPNAKVRVFSNGLLVGQGVTTTSGNYEITTEPLIDGIHNITVELEDLAGNISATSAALVIQVDTLAPQRPTLDLPTVNDTGMFTDDNVTNNPNAVPFTVTLDEADASFPLVVVIKDGNNVIDTFNSAAGGVITRSLNLAEGTHLLSVETTDHAGNRSLQSEELVVEIDRTAPAVAAAPDLLSIADTGMFNNDDVTHIQAVALANPAGTTVEPNTKVRVFSGTELVGQGVATTQGNWEITTEPLDTGTHSLTVVLEDLAGNVNVASAALIINVDAVVPNTPYLDLINDDGHSTDDNITGQNLLQFEMVGNDTVNGNGNPLPNDVIYRLYWRVGDGNGEVLVYDSFAEFGNAFTTLGTLTRTVSQVLNNPAGTPFPDGVHNFKLEIEDRAGNISPDFLLQVKIDTLVPTTTIDVLASSDSGMYDDDNVTNIQEIAFQGRGETNGIITLFAQKVNSAGVVFGELLVIGTGNVGSDFTDVQAGIAGATDTDGLGIWEITAEPLTDGVYDVYALIEDWGGNEAVSETIRLEVDTLDPNLPLLDLDEASDSGRHNDDNITNDNTPSVSLTTHDANADLHVVVPDLTVAGAFLTDYLKYRVYDRAETGVVGGQTLVTETLLYDSATDPTADASISLLGRNAMFTNLLLLNSTNAQTTLPVLADGIHNLKIEVEDRAGNISHDFLLNLVIDTAAPAAPTISLDPAVTDSGIQSNIGSSSDRITNVRTPGFVGTAEADALVRLYADGAAITNNVIDGSDAAIGLTVAVPLDGDDAFPGGQYRATSTADLNVGFAFDGQRQIGGTAEDLAGNVSNPTFLNILLDTTPPTVTGVDYSAGKTVFASKPNLSPTPAVGSLLITFAGGPAAAAGLSSPAVDPGLAADVSNYKLVGDHSGQVLIDNAFIVSSTPEQVVVRIQFAALLADDRYTLTLDDSISDAAGNLLDGDSSAQAPGTPIAVLPSGNGSSGGDFAARFTVDSRPEFGTISQGLVYVDINGNHVFDPEGQDNDATNRDFVMQFGQLTDALFAGNFADGATGVASGFDKLGAYGRFNGTYSFLIDTDDDGVGDVASIMPGQFQVNGIPVAGDFSAAKDGDEIGLFDGQAWYLDLNGNNQIDSNERIATNYNGLPIVGDFNGDGNDDLAVFVNDTNQFIFDTNRDGTADFTWDVRDDFNRFGGLSGFTDRPIVGDINLDGIDDIGIWVKGRQGILPKEQGEVFFWISDRVDNNPANVFDAYSPAPLGNDTFAQYGDETALPIFGNFDPPIASANEPTNLTGLTNSENRYDVNNDGKVTALDALIVINAVTRGLTNAEASQAPRLLAAGGNYLDVDSNEVVTAFDALLVINEINRRGGTGSGEGESTANPISSDSYSAAVDDVFDQVSQEDDDDDIDWIAADLESRRGVLS